jgi:solute carrier family 25 protein 38
MSLNTSTENTRLKRLLAGFMSGSVVSVLTQPLEVIKTTILVNPLRNPLIETTGQVRSLVISSQQIWNYNDGGLKNFFRGSSIACVRQSIGFGLYSFLTEEFIKLSSNTFADYKYIGISTSAGVAKILALAATSPLILVKTRQEVLTINNSIISIAQNVMLHDKFAGFFKGLSPLFYREAIYSVLHYGLYRYLQDQLPKASSTAWGLYLLPSFTAGIVALLISHPFEVIRNRIQSGNSILEDSKRYDTVTHAIGKIYKNEGVNGYFKGLFPRLLRRPLNSGVTWMTYEILLKSKMLERF